MSRVLPFDKDADSPRLVAVDDLAELRTSLNIALARISKLEDERAASRKEVRNDAKGGDAGDEGAKHERISSDAIASPRDSQPASSHEPPVPARRRSGLRGLLSRYWSHSPTHGGPASVCRTSRVASATTYQPLTAHRFEPRSQFPFTPGPFARFSILSGPSSTRFCTC